MEMPRFTRTGAALALVASVALSGCSSQEPSPAPEAIGRCYDQLQPLPDKPELPMPDDSNIPPVPEPPLAPASGELSPEYTAALQEYYAELDRIASISDAVNREYNERLQAYDASMDPPDIHITIADGAAQGYPTDMPSDIAANAKWATVYITTPDYTGTGVVTMNEDGKQVVATAAHLVGEQDTASITIETVDGQTTTPDDGCYIYEGRVVNGEGAANSQDTWRDPTSEAVVSYDVAVLTLNQPLEVDPATLSSTRPDSGEPVYFVNYQGPFAPPPELDYGGFRIEGPVTYPGVVTPQRPGETTLDVITGLNKVPTEDESLQSAGYDANHVTSGSSGGPVFNNNGGVIGIVRSSEDQEPFDPQALRQNHDIIVTGDTAGLEPNPSDITPADIIRTAMAAIEH